MKLRIAGNSVRLRVSRSDLARLIDGKRIEERIHFAAGENSLLIYALEHRPDVFSATLRFQSSEVSIVLPTEEAKNWAESDQVGIYATVDRGDRGPLDLIVEKDFACLDLSDAENADTFSNPRACASGS